MSRWSTMDLSRARDGAAPDDLARALSRLAAARFDDESAEGDRRRVQSFCALHDDALHRSCHDGHLTGSAFVFAPDRSQALLIHHRKLGRWLQPGGHADGEGDLALVALTEATEETGIDGLKVVVPAIDVDIHTIPARGDDPDHLHLDLRFLVLVPPGAEAAPDLTETNGAAWFDLDDPLLADSADHGRMVRRARTVLAELEGVTRSG